jgi:predicted ATPase
LTSFLGREVEVESLRTLLDPARSSARLLTLVGPGGVGKTRLAVATAAALGSTYADGVVFVDLAQLHDPRLVPATIARALDVKEHGGHSAHDLLLEHLRGRQLLMVLDNFEHLLPAAPLVPELLRGCPRMALLVTSRTALRVQGERRFAVAPLAVPSTADPTEQELHAAPAVRLFAERAQAVVADFALDQSTAAAIGAICRWLEGMPLAIELAAARVILLSPAALLGRLENRLGPHAPADAPLLRPGRVRALPLLTGGAADVHPRHRTLHQTLAWSHDLLGPIEQILFRRLAVFAGGWTLEAAEAVCHDARLPADAVLDRLQVLVDSSLIQVRRLESVGGEQRFGMLETVREFALEQLEAAGEDADLRGRHATYFLALSERAQLHLKHAEQADWMDRLDAELDNLRGTLAWARDSGNLELGLRLAVALPRFWDVRQTEGREWLESLMAGLSDSREPHLATLDAQALGTTAWIAYLQGDQRVAGQLATQCLARWRQLGQVGNSPVALTTLAFVAGYEADVPRQEALFEQSLALYRAEGDRRGAAWVLTFLGTVRISADDLAGAEALLTEALAVVEDLSDTAGIALAVQHLGNVAAAQQDFQRAQALLERSLDIYREALHDRAGVAYVLGDLAGLAACRGEFGRAQALCEDSVRLFREVDELRGLAAELGLLGRLAAWRGDEAAAAAAYAECLRLSQTLAKVDLVLILEWLAELCAREGQRPAQHEQLLVAVHLFGAAAALRDRLGGAASRSWAIPLAPPHHDEYAHQVAATRATLGDEAFDTTWQEGRAMTPDQAVAWALAQPTVSR